MLRPYVFLTLLLTLGSAQAQESPPDSVAARLDRLERDIESIRKENARLRDELGLEGKAGAVVVKPAGREPTLSFGGLLQVQGEAGDQGDTRFTSHNDRIYLRRTRVNAIGRFLEDFDFKVELDLTGSLAEVSALRAQLTDGYVRWNRFAAGAARMGQFKSPFGYEQLVPDPRLFTIERSLANDRLTLGRQIGVQAEGEVLTKRFSYAVGMFNSNGVNTSFNDNESFLGVARIAAVPLDRKLVGTKLRWTAGANAYGSRDAALLNQPGEFGFSTRPSGPRDNTFSGERWGYGVDSQLHTPRFDLWLEYLRSRFDPTGTQVTQRIESQGGYVQLAGFVVEKRFQLVAKFDGFDPRRNVDSNSTRNWLAGANYYVKADDIKLQLNYILTDEEASKKDEDRVLGRVQIIF